MNKGIIVWIILILIVVGITYYYTRFNINLYPTTSTSTVAQATTSIAASQNSTIYTTTLPNQPLSCINFELQSLLPYDNVTARCTWDGGILGVWVKAGTPGPGTIRISGANITYLNASFSYNCTTFYKNITLPAQILNVSLLTGPGGGTCGSSLVKLNLTIVPPKTIYPYIYNGNFSNAEYTGWSLSDPGFGNSPLNITMADSPNSICYIGRQWSNYVGSYFATTFNCGLSVSPGNITSAPFRVNPRTTFLNFKIISPDDKNIYVEILELNSTNYSAQGVPVIIAHYNSYNSTSNTNASSNFLNASIPLTSVTNKVVEVKVVADTLSKQRYIAVGDFSLASLPVQDSQLNSNLTVLSH